MIIESLSKKSHYLVWEIFPELPFGYMAGRSIPDRSMDFTFKSVVKAARSQRGAAARVRDR